jgi:hypothetical protein
LPGNRLTVEVVTVSGRAAAVGLHLRQDRVEVWHHLRRVAEFDRPTLRRWLAAPQGPLSDGEVVLSLDRLIDVEGRVAISLPDVQLWPFSPGELDILRRRI